MSSIMEYKGYHASVEYDPDDKIFIGEVFGINDSLNFHATSVTELKEMFKQSLDNYLDLCKKINKDPDKEFKGSFNVHIPPEMHKKAVFAAKTHRMTLNQYVTIAIDDKLKKGE